MKAIRNAILSVLTLSAISVATPAAALEPLEQERYINDRLVAARVADRIRRACPTLDARIVRAFSQARALKAYALKKGYSAAEIDAFLDDKSQRKRIYAIAETYMAQNGVKPADPESFCRLGRSEIAQGTVSGSLLVAR